jgi:hypothetical protein
VSEIHNGGISVVEKNEGPIRIPLRFPLLLFNSLALPTISSKSFEFRRVLFSIPTASTKLPSNQHLKRFDTSAGRIWACKTVIGLWAQFSSHYCSLAYSGAASFR